MSNGKNMRQLVFLHATKAAGRAPLYLNGSLLPPDCAIGCLKRNAHRLQGVAKKTKALERRKNPEDLAVDPVYQKLKSEQKHMCWSCKNAQELLAPYGLDAILVALKNGRAISLIPPGLKASYAHSTC